MNESNPKEIDEFCRLIDLMCRDLNHLKEETVRYRYALSCYLDSQDQIGLQSEIFSDLIHDYSGNRAYRLYVEHYCNGHDPLENERHLQKMIKLAHYDK